MTEKVESPVKAKRPKLPKRITIEEAGNGFLVEKSMDSEEYFGRNPYVFTSLDKALKFVKDCLTGIKHDENYRGEVEEEKEKKRED